MGGGTCIKIHNDEYRNIVVNGSAESWDIRATEIEIQL